MGEQGTDEEAGAFETGAPAEEETLEKFSSPVTFISWSRNAARNSSPYAFIVVGGEIYVPGFLVGDYKVKVGHMVHGVRKVMTTGRLPFRATAVDTVDGPEYNVEDSPDDRSDVSNDSEQGIPMGEARSSGDGSSVDSSDDTASVAQRLFNYIESYQGEIRVAAPPQVKGSLAHFYARHHGAATVIKTFELPGMKPGVQAFAKGFPHLFLIAGKQPKIRLVARGSAAERRAEAETKAERQESYREAAAKATEAGGAFDKKALKPANPANGLKQVPNGAPHDAAPIISKAAKEAAMRAAASANGGNAASTRTVAPVVPVPPTATASPTRSPGTAFVPASTAHHAPAVDFHVDMREQMAGLRSDLSVAMVALASARERMSRLETAIGVQLGASTFAVNSSVA